jgi:hypothetical protein
LKVHFIHEKARKRGNKAIPLLLVHGWPGTFFELSALERLWNVS